MRSYINRTPLQDFESGGGVVSVQSQEAKTWRILTTYTVVKSVHVACGGSQRVECQAGPAVSAWAATAISSTDASSGTVVESITRW